MSNLPWKRFETEPPKAEKGTVIMRGYDGGFYTRNFVDLENAPWQGDPEEAHTALFYVTASDLLSDFQQWQAGEERG